MEGMKGVTRAVAALRGELHSLGMPGAAIVIEVNEAQWHAVRQLYKAGPAVKCVVLEGTTAGEAGGPMGGLRIQPMTSAVPTKLISVDDLGLAPVTLERKVEQLEGLVRQLLEHKPAVPPLERVEAFARVKGYGEQLGADLATLKEKVKALERSPQENLKHNLAEMKLRDTVAKLEPLVPYVGPLVNIEGVGQTFDKHHDRMDAIEATIAEHLKALDRDGTAISNMREQLADTARQVANLEATAADDADLADLKADLRKRVDEVEGYAAGVNTKVEVLAIGVEQLGDLRAQLEGLDDKLEQLAGKRRDEHGALDKRVRALEVKR